MDMGNSGFSNSRVPAAALVRNDSIGKMRSFKGSIYTAFLPCDEVKAKHSLHESLITQSGSRDTGASIALIYDHTSIQSRKLGSM